MSTRKIYTNTAAQIAGKIGTALISILLIKILTNYLDVAGYGLYSKIYNYLSIFSVIADLGLYTITVREIAEKKDDVKKVESILGNVLTLRTIMGLVIIIVSILISFFLPGYNTFLAQIGILITGFFTLFGLINSSIMSYLQATLQTEKSAIGNVLGKLLTLIIITLSAFFLAPAHSSGEITRYILVLLAGLVGNIAMTAYTYTYASKLIPIRFHYSKEYIIEIFHKSLPYGFALFLNVIFFKVDVLLISFIESHKIADISIALYSVPMKMVEVGMMYGTIFLNSLLPELTSKLKKIRNIDDSVGNKEDCKDVVVLIKKGYKILFFFGLGVSAFLFSFSREILVVISSEKFAANANLGYTSLDAMHIVSWIFVLYFISSLSTYIMIALGKEKRMIYINGFIAVLNIIGNLLLIPYYSFYGSALASLISQIFLLILTSWQVKNLLPIKTILYYSASLIILAIIASYLCRGLYFSNLGNILVGCLVYGIIYLGGAWGVNRYLLKNI